MYRSVSKRSPASWAIVCTIVLAGCGKGKKGPTFDLTPVAGTITMDGKPLADAEVGFYLQGAAPQGYYGSGAKTDAEGKYVLKTGDALGAVAGQYKVTVSRLVGADGAAIVPEEGMDVEQLKMMGEAKESIPAQYNDLEKTELDAKVEAGKADGYDFQLSSS
ncbi:MAG TPA: carboxypeptidase regulatory-like domain-containing protein [Pirellulales bacterium]|nr:carboxypeptidase regulatory-like domain-containing protein [Pirellulales bacterium]